MKEYRIIVAEKAYHVQSLLNSLAAEGFTLTGPVQFAIDGDDDRNYIATIEREVEPEENE